MPIDTNISQIKTRMSELRASLFSKEEGEVWLYGSRARGDYNSDSDWDILLIVDTPISFRDAYNRYAYPFVELGWNYNQSVIPVIYTKQEWEKSVNSMFYNNVIKDRVRI